VSAGWGLEVQTWIEAPGWRQGWVKEKFTSKSDLDDSSVSRFTARVGPVP
jgi:hypothetical protein